MDTSVTELIGNATSGGDGSTLAFYNLHPVPSKFLVKQTKLSEFILDYCELVYEDYTSSDRGSARALGIAECLADVSDVPIAHEFNLRFHRSSEEDDGTGILDESFILVVVYCYQQAIIDIFNIDSGLSQITAVILESEPQLTESEILVRFRIQFPYCKATPDIIRRRVLPNVMKMLRSKNALSHLPLQPVGDWGEIIQGYEGYFPMYGSAHNGENKLVLSHIYGEIDEAAFDRGTAPEIRIEKAFDARKHTFVSNGMIPESELSPDVAPEYYLPLYLSPRYCTVVTTPRRAAGGAGTASRGLAASGVDPTSSDPRDIARILLPLLHEKRGKEVHYWMDVGRVLYNITNGGPEGLKMWSEFSERHGRFTAKMCAEKYDILGGTQLSVKTIAWYARDDNSGEYDKWHKAWMTPALHASLSLTHSDVASAVFKLFWLEYMYDPATDTWWRFYGHTLKPMNRALYLRKGINTKLIYIFEDIRKSFSDKSSAGMKDSEVKEREEAIKQISALIRKIKTDTFMNSVVRACQAVGSPDYPASGFDVEGFGRIVDSEPNRTGWANCVIECVGHNAVARPGKPEDFITKVSPVGLRVDFSWKHSVVIEVMNFFEKVFVDPELRHHVLKRVASILKGRNGEKLFDILSGSGDNGKSIYVALLKATLGPYAVDFPVSMLMGTNKSSGSASPEVAQARGAHAAFVSEPDSGDDMKAGPIKRFTGNDSFFCRMLFDNGGSIESFFKLFYMCNRIPNIPNADKAVKERLWVCPFLSTFCKLPLSETNPDGYPLDPDQQIKMRRFQADPDFHSRIPELAYGLLWIMVQYYPAYAKDGLKPVPDIVTEVTNEHWRDNDAYVQFIQEKIDYAYVVDEKTGDYKTGSGGVKEVDSTKTLSATTIYPVFNQWWKLYFPGTPIPNVRDMKAELSSKGRLGTQNHKQQWCGVKIRDSAPVLADGAALGPVGGTARSSGRIQLGESTTRPIPRSGGRIPLGGAGTGEDSYTSSSSYGGAASSLGAGAASRPAPGRGIPSTGGLATGLYGLGMVSGHEPIHL